MNEKDWAKLQELANSVENDYRHAVYESQESVRKLNDYARERFQNDYYQQKRNK